MQVTTTAEKLFFTTVRIETFSNDRNYVGTGFFAVHRVNEVEHPFIVTARHVVEKPHSGRFSFLKKKDEMPALGNLLPLDIDSDEWTKMWVKHPDPAVDIAICRLDPLVKRVRKRHGADLFCCPVFTDSIPGSARIAGELKALESVTFIGYPNGIWDSKNFLPVVRQGTTASPMEVDFKGTPRFIIDASVFGGSSGSPVFIFNQDYWTTRRGGFATGSRLFWVGVLTSVFCRTKGQILTKHIPTQVTSMAQEQEMLDLGIVFKARTVIETINALMLGITSFRSI